jgi:hypothetical protein
MKPSLTLWLLLLPLSLFSQLTESFSGTYVTFSNPWEGDTEKFAVNASGQLQFTSPSGEAGSVSLRLPLPFHKQMTWEMDVKLDFKSTDANNLRLYVYAPDSVYIQVGNNTRRVSLYEKGSSNTAKLRITGRKALLDEPYSFVTVRLTLEEGRLWTLYTRKEGEQEFRMDGSWKMSSPVSSPQAFLMITCRYIKGRVSNFYMDNLKVSGETTGAPEPEPEPEPEPDPIPDPEPAPEEYAALELSSTEMLNDRELQFRFNIPVLISEAVCKIEDTGEATLRYGPDQATVILRFPEPLKSGREYVAVITGLYDLNGKPIPRQTWEVLYEEEEEEEEDEEEEKEDEDISPPLPSAEPGQVVISEVMANPKGSAALPETEYVELHNLSEAPVSLNGWAFVYDGKRVAIEALSLPSGGYAVLYRAGRSVHVDKPGLAAPLSQFPSALSNTGKLLQLEDAAGELMDEFYYPQAQPGISWERRGDEAYLSTDTRGGTPGSPNSVPGPAEEPEDTLPDMERGEVVFNELLPDPFSGGSEYVELYNRSGRTLFLQSLALAVRKSDGSLGTSYPLSGLSSPLDAEGYVLLTKNAEGVASFYLLSSPDAVYEMKMPLLANASSSLVLFRVQDGAVIDEVTYSAQWHDTSVKATKGVALERIDPDAGTQDAGNWTSAASTAGYGTPGYRNSQFRNAEKDDTPTGISAPVLMEDGLYHIPYHLASPGYRCRIYLYNMAGALVAEIANHELPGESGEFLWDGRSSAGERPETGIYILYAELYHTNGQKKRQKTVFLVR